ncbi:MAG: pyridoxamine 5'-phosphate oxidase family protein [Muribaculaceae bacterium]|nr:pyridoxamine 5'-phosphate oxidase family protein [Roseburia sp.]MCM1432223.1 pyridoxamine 5'-phosphate oxidase family protein [Muribaculaceae bacterium]MCM1492000.1 pyridoxamine 5'-phosphate oxidase family protein [Muribaculaceae bacterium]
MRRRDRQLTEKEAMEILQQGEYGILSTMGSSYPYGVPVNYVVIDHVIYIHGSCEGGQKAEHINKNSNVCFTVVGATEVIAEKFGEKYESAIVFGKAKEVDAAAKEKALEAFLDKYSSEYKEAGMKYLHAAKDKVSVYGIAIEQITGKARR